MHFQKLWKHGYIEIEKFSTNVFMYEFQLPMLLKSEKLKKDEQLSSFSLMRLFLKIQLSLVIKQLFQDLDNKHILQNESKSTF